MKESFRLLIARIKMWYWANFVWDKTVQNDFGQPFIPDKEAWNKLEDKKHLEWLYQRMIIMHAENPHYDYMIKFKEIIDKM